LLVIEEFSNVFLKELPWLPLIKEVNYKIYLTPRVTHILKAPYKLGTNYTGELKMQLFCGIIAPAWG
jgi:hypothetical protein